MICQRGKSTAVGQYDLTECEWQMTYCHRTTDWKQAIFCLGLKVMWQQWSEEIKQVYTYWQICTTHNKHIAYADWGDRTITVIQHNTTYGSGQRNYIFFFLDMTILNSFLLLTACGTKMIHRDLKTFPHVEPDWKGWESTLPTQPSAGPVFHRNKLHTLKLTSAIMGPLHPPDYIATLVLHED
jgi:hypothetical protein